MEHLSSYRPALYNRDVKVYTSFYAEVRGLFFPEGKEVYRGSGREETWREEVERVERVKVVVRMYSIREE